MEKRQNTRAMQQGNSQREIYQILQVGLAIVNRNISDLRIKLNTTSKDTLMN
jgi:hypothetical protein